MRCIDAAMAGRRLALLAALLAVLLVGVAACGDHKAVPQDVVVGASASGASGSASAAAAPASAVVAGAASQASAVPAASTPASAVATASAVRTAASAKALLPLPRTPIDIDDLQLQFAQRLVAAHPGSTYLTPAPDRLLAIPVLEVELNGDGSVKHIVVLRKPTTGQEGIAATQLAIAAVRRAAPYGNLSRLPKPWKVVETFLFDDSLHFKPRTLDL